MSHKNKEHIARYFETNIVSTPEGHCPWVWRDGNNWRFVTDATSCKIAGIIEEKEKLERENAAMKAAIRALAARDFGSRGWDAECESAVLRLRAFLSA